MVDTLLAAVGIVVKEPWADDISYEMLNYTLWKVQDGGDGCGYVALKDNIGVRPDSDQTVWRKAVEAGQSIYDLAVKYGHFDGTEEEFEAQYQAVLQAARDAASATNATNEQVMSAEALRVEAEQNRVSSETSRVSAEESRASAELTRENDEQARRNNESGRSVAEQSRATAEQNRVSAENSRVSAENNRANAEVDRRNTFEALEEDMETAIGQADAATAAASAINNQIVSAENSRVSAENGRVTAEGNRVTAEQERATAETSRATAENSRVTAEESRASAETSRATAETNRETRANTDHNTATSDHETAASDHTTAASDHTQAGTDHERAESDHSRAEEDHASIADKVSQEELAQAIEPLASKDGSYDTMSVGLAKNLEGRTNVTGSFFERTAGGDAEVANGLAQMTEVGGNSVKFNQLLRGVNSAPTVYGITRTRINDYCLKYSGTSTNSTNYTGANVSGLVANHFYYLAAKGTPDNCRISVAATIGVDSRILLTGITSTSYGVYIPNGVTIDSIVCFAVIDLTAIFGADAEIAAALGITTAEITTDAGVAAFEAWLAENVGLRAYYPYNPGSVLNVNMAGIETVGRNLLDQATGKARILGAYSDVYGNYYGITGTHGAITFTSDMGETSTITPDEDGKFLLEEPGELSVADAGADCCVFLWWDGTQTDYVEHKDEKTYLDVTHIYGKLNGTGDLIRVWPTGMPKVNGLKDTLRIEDGQVVARRVFGEIDMGTLEWNYSSGNNNFYKVIPGIKVQVNAGLLCSKYITVLNSEFSSSDKAIATNLSGGTVQVRDTAYSDEATFKTAMSGIPLYFELATPQVYTDLVYQGSEHFDDGAPVTLPLNYNVDNWGIERVLPLNTSEALATAKPELTCKYSIDAVETMNTHADEIEDLYDKNEELDAKKPNKTGDYPGMAVGSAKVLEGTDSKVEDFVFTAPQCADGIAKLNEVRGKSLVWNQLESVTATSARVSYDSEANTYTSTPYHNHDSNTAGSDNYSSGWTKISQKAIQGHRYYISMIFGRVSKRTDIDDFTPSPAVLIMCGGDYKRFNVSVGETISIDTILTAESNSDVYFTNNDCVCTTKNTKVFDLTLMFGAGNEPATVDEFEALYTLPYYAYNAGKIISNKTEAVEVTGRNLWDNDRYEVAEGKESYFVKEGANTVVVSTISYSEQYNRYDLTRFRNGGAVYIVANCETLSLEDSRALFTLRLFYTDGSYSYKQYRLTAVGNREKIELAQENGKVADYFTFAAWAYSGSARVSMCINLSDPSFNGQYEPYKKNTVELNIPTLTGKLNGEGESVVVFPEGMRGAGTAYDKAAGKRGEVVMAKYVFTGNEAIALSNWRPADGTYAAVFAASAIPGFKSTVNNTDLSNFILPGVDNKTYQEIYNGANGATLYNGAYSLVIRVPSSIATDNATLLAWLMGKELIYELAEPLVYELDEGVPETFQAYKGGTLRQLPENGSEPTTAPCVISVTYALDAVGILTGLPQNYISKESLQAMLTAMQSAGLFASYTMTYNATTGKYEFTFTANS